MARVDMTWVSRVAAAIAVVCGVAAAACGDDAPTTMIVYGKDWTNSPQYRMWAGSSWSTARSALDVGAVPKWVVAKKCPIRNEVMVAVADSAKDLNVQLYNGTSWTNKLEFSGNLQAIDDRAFYVEYEQVSGKALVVYRAGNSNGTMYYRTWNGTAWSSQGTMQLPGNGGVKWMKLVAKPGSNEIMMLAMDHQADLTAFVWNGSSFGTPVELESDASFAGLEGFDAAYERSSGRCMVVWGSSSSPKYRVWTGTAWLTAGTLPAANTGSYDDDNAAHTHYNDGGWGALKWVRLAADPASNKIIAFTIDGVNDVHAVVWSGTAWGPVSYFSNDIGDTDRRVMDVMFEPTGTRAVAMWGRTGKLMPYYRVYDGTSWSAMTAGPSLGVRPSVIQMTPATSGQEILIALSRTGDQGLTFMRWSGTSLSTSQVIESSLAGPSATECFMVCGGTTGTTVPKIVSWKEVGRD